MVSAFVLTCTTAVRIFRATPFIPMAMIGRDGTLGVSVERGDALTCEWYGVPDFGLRSTVQVYACWVAPPSIDTCDPASEVVRFLLAPSPGEGDSIEFQTSDDGTAHLASVEGTYTLVEAGHLPCLIESNDNDARGSITIGAEEEMTVRVFHCG